MIRPDLLISWPRSADYPLWRAHIKEHREKYNNVIVVFTETNHGYDYREFVKQAMFSNFVLFLNSPQIVGDEDWRNIAMRFGLQQSLHTEWIYFTEQDFYPKETYWDFWDDTKQVIGVYDGPRLHPCSLLIKREVLNKTRLNFGIVPGKLDHFGLIQEDLVNMGVEITQIPEEHYWHMNGLSHNFNLISDGLFPNYKPEEFNKYLQLCIMAPVTIDDEFRRIVINYFNRTSANHSPTVNIA